MSGGGDRNDDVVLLRSNSSSSDNRDLEGQVSSPKSSGRSSNNKSIKHIWSRLDRAFSGRRLSVKRRSPRARWNDRDHVSPRRSGVIGGDDEILGDGAPPEWALLLVGCLLGVATGLCVAAFNRGVNCYLFSFPLYELNVCRFDLVLK